MKRLLFSSFLVIALISAKCSQESEATEETQSVEPVSVEKAEEVKPVEEMEEPEKTQEAPAHQSPDQSKIDSIKASFPEKK